MSAADVIAAVRDGATLFAHPDTIADLAPALQNIAKPNRYLEPGKLFALKLPELTLPNFKFETEPTPLSTFITRFAFRSAITRFARPPRDFFRLLSGIVDDGYTRPSFRERVLARKRIEKRERRARIKADNARRASRKR
jgi:hypothetical protein